MFSRNFNNFYLLIGLLVARNISLYAQADTTGGVLKDVEFVIEKERINQLPEANRLFKKAPLSPLNEKTNLSLYHKFYDLPVPFSPIDHKIRILKDQVGLLHRLYGKYLILGHGNYWSPTSQLWINNIQESRYGYGLHLTHWSEGKKKYLERYDNQAELHGKIFTEKLAIAGKINYQGERYPYIQYLNNLKQTENDTAVYATYHHLKFNAHLYNHVPDSSLNYYLALQVIHCRNQIKEQENQGEGILKGDYSITERLLLRSTVRLHTNKYLSNTPASQRYLISLNPLVVVEWNKFTGEGGLHTVYQNDKTASPNHFYLYPALKVSYQWDKALQPYVSLGGNLQEQTWHGLIAQNPWLLPIPNIRYTNQSMIFTLGAHTEWPFVITGNTGMEVTNAQNVPFFVNDLAELRRFNIAYDEATTTIKLFTDISKTSLEGALTTRLAIAKFYYTLTTVKEAWHQPSYTLECHNRYNFHDKILFKNTLHWLGGLKAFEPYKKASIDLPAVLDLGFGIEYVWNERFSILLDMYNLIARDNERYLYTPTDGVRFCLSVSYGF